MKLNKEEIQFIDNYLQKSDVIFVDIKAEMVDHIATAVEEKMEVEKLDFYNAFKDYMVENKKEILKNNKENWSYSWSEIKKFSLFLIKPKMLILLGLVLLTSNFIFKKTMFNFLVNKATFFFMSLAVFIATIQIIYFYFILKKRFYYIEKNGQILMVLYWINIFLIRPFFESTDVYFYETQIFLFLFLGYIFFSIQQTRQFFKLKLNTL